jgi:uncharacterized glyoxalase superfamily protein PhnB
MSPYIIVKRASLAIEFYVKAFGATEYGSPDVVVGGG